MASEAWDPVGTEGVHDRIREYWDADAHTYDETRSHSISDTLEAAAWRQALAEALPPSGAVAEELVDDPGCFREVYGVGGVEALGARLRRRGDDRVHSPQIGRA